ncbi:hypothetical protein [Marinobacterium jannaschii]|uniref:hypothetical protein n=1 Tax=Marinobacterium jannaschii TaxID=64970 RepID=UPI000A3EDC7D|nr:hypothetical protein [Marinobacterium jannaschii]
MGDLSKITSAIKALPQASVLVESDVKTYLKSCLEAGLSEREILWHIKRKGAVGGSEMGTLLLEADGRVAPFDTTEGIIADKLFKRPFKPLLQHMRRGVVLEEAVRMAILKVYGGERDVKAELAMRMPHPDSPADLAGNADLIWLLKDNRFVVDIKIPLCASEETIRDCSTNEKHFLYASQVHEYGLLLEKRGYNVDGHVIAELDIDKNLAESWTRMLESGDQSQATLVNTMLERMVRDNLPGCRINMVKVDPDMTTTVAGRSMHVHEAMQLVATQTMDAVISGIQFTAPKPSHPPLSESNTAHLAALENRLASVRAVTEVADKMHKSVVDEINQLARGHDLGSGIKGSVHDIKAKEVFDTDAAVAQLQKYSLDLTGLKPAPKNPQAKDYDAAALIKLCQNNGLDVSACLKPGKYQEELVKDALRSVGESPQQFTEEGIHIAKSRRGPANKQYQQIREELEQPLRTRIESAIAPQQKTVSPEVETPSVLSPMQAV